MRGTGGFASVARMATKVSDAWNVLEHGPIERVNERLWRVVADETRGQAELRDTADYREGFAAFQEKRKPAFIGA